LKETFFEIITPWLPPTSTTAEKTAVLTPAVTQLLTKLFTVDPHAQVMRYSGSEDMPNQCTIMGTIRRGKPVSQWTISEWKLRIYLAENFFIHKSGDPQKSKTLIAHTCPAADIMASINPPLPPQGELLVPLPRSLDWTLSVAALQTEVPVTVALLYGTVHRTHHGTHCVDGMHCDMDIVLKPGLFKKSLYEEIGKDNKAYRLNVW
jgi:hypothetical protein